MTWGDQRRGGDSSKVQAYLTHVESIVGNMEGFAALTSEGYVVPWGSYLSKREENLYYGYTHLEELIGQFVSKYLFLGWKENVNCI